MTCVDCGADITYRRNAKRCRPCNYEAKCARDRVNHAATTCNLFIVPCQACGRLYVRRRGNAMFCLDCRAFYRSEQLAAASRRYYAKSVRRVA